MRRSATIATRIMRLAPVILQMIWGPALGTAMLNTPVHTQSGFAVAAPAHGPISAVYAGMFNPIRPINSIHRGQNCIMAAAFSFGLNAAGTMHTPARFPAYPLAAADPTAASAQNHGCDTFHAGQAPGFHPSNARENTGLVSMFNTLYAVNKPGGLEGMRIPKFMPSYWGRLANERDWNTHPNWNSRSQKFAAASRPSGNFPIADLVKAGFFRLVELAQNTW